MVKSNNRHDPNIVDILEVFGIIQPSPLGLMLQRNEHSRRP